jgi:hypothetical protein
MYYACPTRELADYTNTVIGLSAITLRLTGELPNISPATGEPEYEGQSKDILDALRSSAHVRTFDEAVMHCKIGSGVQRLIVANMPTKGLALTAWVVVDGKPDVLYWMPSAFLIPRK